MNLRNLIVTLTIISLAAMTTAVSGCKKKEQPPPPPAASKTETMDGMMHQAAATTEEANQAVQAQLASIEQKTCPITGQQIDPSVFVEYKGKKVYFCCSMCIAQFNKDPEKYLSKLPQFSK